MVKIILVEKNKTKNGQNDELGAQLSQVFCLFPFVKMIVGKGTVSARKEHNKRAESSHILQATKYQAKCEARTRRWQDILLHHLDKSYHVQTPQQSIIN